MFSSLSGIFLFINVLLIASPCHSHTWLKFETFLDAKRGSNITHISELKKYFHRFGYLQKEREDDRGQELEFSDLFDEKLEAALIRYQSKFGLPVTGDMDSQTLRQIMSPRCGVTDTKGGAWRSIHATKHFSYFQDQPRWDRDAPMTLTYALSPVDMISSLSMSIMKTTFKQAFGHWESVTPVTFLETDDYEFADIKIGFYNGDHGDGEAFDGVLGILAHAFSPENGRLHLDAAETWAVDFDTEKSRVAVDLESVATHEIGHLLGLSHTTVKEAVMYPSLKPREKKVELKMDDVRGIQALYGSNPNFSVGAFSESDISSSGAAVVFVGIRSLLSTCLALMMIATYECLVLINVFIL